MGDTQSQAPPKFKLGDEVIVYQPSYGHREPGQTFRTTVAKVGLKYFYIDPESVSWGWQYEKRAFDKNTGQMKTNPSGNSSYDPQVWVPAEWEAKEHRAEVTAALRETGLRYETNYGARPELSIEKLERLLAVMQEDC